METIPYGAVTLMTRSLPSKVGQAPGVSRPGPISEHLSEEAVGCEHVDTVGTSAGLCQSLALKVAMEEVFRAQEETMIEDKLQKNTFWT